jgi:hypothetical protein
MAAQDWIMAGAQLCFAPSMLFSIRTPDKPALRTSLANTCLVAIIAICQATLGLWAAAATSALVGATWAVLAAQKLAGDSPT